jgi:medium-chain acyl-[acyl-carrier-protein] hydrolase
VSKVPGTLDFLDRWLPYLRPRKKALVRLVCFPAAGCPASVFHGWDTKLPENLEVCAIQLPGREQRLGEQAFTRMDALVESLAEVLQPLLDRPLALLGHSLGAKVAFELARRIHKEESSRTVHLFVSGCPAPHIPHSDPLIYSLPDEKLIEKLRELGGTPQAVLEQPDLMRLLLPVLRADFEVDNTYSFKVSAPLDCAISAFGGTEDPLAPPPTIDGWREHTRSTFRCRFFKGKHFFLYERIDEVLAHISRDLAIHI